MAESTAKLREEIMALSGVDIMLNDNSFKSTYDIMDELAAKWQELTDIERATITNLIAGTRQGNVVSALMNNFDVARETLETSMNSDGSALAEHSKYMDSLDAKTQQFKSSWQDLSQTFLNSDILKGLIDSGTTAVSILTELIDTFGSLNVMLAGGGIIAFLKNLD